MVRPTEVKCDGHRHTSTILYLCYVWHERYKYQCKIVGSALVLQDTITHLKQRREAHVASTASTTLEMLVVGHNLIPPWELFIDVGGHQLW